MAANDEIFQPGGRIGRYEIEQRLGEGGMCVVWKGRHRELGKAVAIKVLKPDHGRNEIARGRFVREGEALAKIHHANVIEVHDVGIVGDSPYLVMEFLEGEDLRAFFQRRGALSPGELADVMVPVCAGVAAAHDEQIIHRDLKPENIFLARTRDRGIVPKVLDFGISRVNDDSGRADTGTAAFMGTPRYMSPEQTRGAKYLDARSDQYSLGVVLYQGATGVLPIDELALLPLLQRIVAGQFAPPRAVRFDLPEEIDRLIQRAMATAPEGRYVTVRALGAALLPFASDRVRMLHGENLLASDTVPEVHDRLSPPALVVPTVALTPTQPWEDRPFSPPRPFSPGVPSHHTTLGDAVREMPIGRVPARPARRRLTAIVGAAIATTLLVGVAVMLMLPRASSSSGAPADTNRAREPRAAASTMPTMPLAPPPRPAASAVTASSPPVTTVVTPSTPTPLVVAARPPAQPVVTVRPPAQPAVTVRPPERNVSGRARTRTTERAASDELRWPTPVAAPVPITTRSGEVIE